MQYHSGVEVLGNTLVTQQTMNGVWYYVFEIDVEGNGIGTGPLAVARIETSFFGAPPTVHELNLLLDGSTYPLDVVQFLGGTKEVKWNKDDWKTNTFVHPSKLGHAGYTNLQAYVSGSGAVTIGDPSYDTALNLVLFDDRGLNIGDTYDWTAYLGDTANLEVYISRLLYKLDWTSSPPHSTTLHYDITDYPLAPETSPVGITWLWGSGGVGIGNQYGIWLTGELASPWSGFDHIVAQAKLITVGGSENLPNAVICPSISITPLVPVLASVDPTNQALEAGGSVSVHLEGDADETGYDGRVQIIGRNKTTGEDEVIGETGIGESDFTDGEADKVIPINPPDYPPEDPPIEDYYEDFRTRVTRELPVERDGNAGPNPPPTKITTDPDGYVKESEINADVEEYPDAFMVVEQDVIDEGGRFPASGGTAWLMTRDGSENGFPKYSFGAEDDLVENWSFESSDGHQTPSGKLYWADNGDGTGYWRLDFSIINIYGSNGSRDFSLTSSAASSAIPRGSFQYPERAEGDAGDWIGTEPLRWSSSSWWIGASTNYGVGDAPKLDLYGVNQT